jgi:hypothetical protein
MKTLPQNLLIDFGGGLGGGKKPPPYQHGGDMLIKAVVRTPITSKREGRCRAINILLFVFFDIKH